MVSVWLVAALFGPALHGQLSGPAARLAAGYELERGSGELERALELYREALAVARQEDPELAARVLFRIGVCERQRGRWQEADNAWRELLALVGPEHELAQRARVALRELRGERERIVVTGLITDERGPVGGAYVLAGDWGHDPAVLTGPDGKFRSETRVTSEGGDAQRCVVYAEHPVRPLVAVEAAMVSNGTAVVELRLRPAASVGGRVRDEVGQPVAGARLTVVAFLEADGESLFVPYGRLLAPLATDSTGSFWLQGLAPGLRLKVGAEHTGYRLRRAAEVRTVTATVPTVDIVMDRTGHEMLAGRVTDERGRPLSALVRIFSADAERRELGLAWTGLDGRYRVGQLPAGLLSVRVEPAAAEGVRSLWGVPAGSEGVDFVLHGGPKLEPQAVIGNPAPELAVVPLGPGPLSLASLRGQVVVLAFWSQQYASNPPTVLAAWHRKYAGRGLRVIAIHDHGGIPEALVRVRDGADLPYAFALDRYGPTTAAKLPNSMTAGLYDAGAGDAALVDRAGVLRDFGSLADAEVVERLERTLLEWLAPEGATAPEPTGAVPGSLLRGQPAPALDVATWIRGEPVNGGPLTEVDLRGRVVVLHFSSAYVEVLGRAGRSGVGFPLEQIARLYGSQGVMCVWILPSSDGSEEARMLALRTVADVPIGVDRDGATYRSFGVSAPAENVVLDEEGRVWAAGCSDFQVFRTVKELLMARGFLRY